MKPNAFIRQIHRWLSLGFTVAVVANIVAMITLEQGKTALWIGFMALVPLIPLLATGLYLFVLPYVSNGRSARNTAAQDPS